MMHKQRTPKVFFSSYKPKQPTTKNPGQFNKLIIVGLIIIGGYFLTRLPIFQIKNININIVDNTEVVSELNELLGQSILSSRVASKIREIESNHVELISLRCDKGIPDTLRCIAIQRIPTFAWSTNGIRYLIDEKGFAYKVADKEKVIVIEDRANITVNLGEQLMSEEIVLIYKDIETYLVEDGYVIDEFFIKGSALHPGVVTGSRQGGKPFPPQAVEVEFSASYPISVQIKLLSQTIETKAGLIKEKIDLRTPGYIYYK